MRKIRAATQNDVKDIERGHQLLREARELFVRAGAPNTADKVRAAIFSADGARRHVYRRLQADV
jgi:hypothetical protein